VHLHSASPEARPPNLLPHESPAPADRVGLVIMALAALLHAVALTSLELGFLDPLFNDAENRLGKGADLFAVYQAGSNFLSGASVYAAGATDVPYAYPFRYLPFAGFSFGAVLSLLPPWPAYWSWIAFNEALLLVNVALTLRYAPNRTWRTAGVCMWLLFTPFYLELYMGQFSFLMASLFFWLGLSLQLSAPGQAISSWTGSLLVKSNSLLFLPFLWKVGWTRGAILGLVLVAVLNLPYFLLVEDSWETWTGNLRSFDGETRLDPHAGNLGLPSLLGLPARGPDPGGLDQALARVAGLPWPLLLLGLAGAATILSSYRHRLRLLGLWICSYFLVYGEVWEHHYVMLLPVLVLLLMFDERLRAPALAAFVLIALPTPYALFQTGAPPLDYSTADPQAQWTTLQVYAHHLSKVLPTALLWLALLAEVATGDQRSIRENLSVNWRLTETRLLRPLHGTR
jgi:hypothetical protein